MSEGFLLMVMLTMAAVILLQINLQSTDKYQCKNNLHR